MNIETKFNLGERAKNAFYIIIGIALALVFLAGIIGIIKCGSDSWTPFGGCYRVEQKIVWENK